MNYKINLLFWLLSILTLSCQNPQKPMEPRFDWQETLSCPPGYPIEVYKGGLYNKNEGYTSLYLGPHTGKRGWGATGRSMSSGVKALPDSLAVTWVSYAEDCFYKVNAKLDKEKMTQLFRTSYQLKNIDDTFSDEYYNTIVVGMAPGGVVVVWLAGIGRQTEVGRYQGEKTVIPQAEIDHLDEHDQLIFDPKFRKETMESEPIVPKEVQEAHKGKPIPYGLWDTYRIRYNWVPVFEIPNEGKMGDIIINYFNGEIEDIKREEIPLMNFEKKTIPRRISMEWKSKEGKLYAGEIFFNEASIFQAFKEFYEKNLLTHAQLKIRVNMPNTYITFMLTDGEKEIPVKTDKLKVY
ncbi:DUF2931 family protein [Apibacter muscae]|uniref:DUF2931 family protein n=1 Tax=Apibacter muscae TaxID=2509004 RepID=UPI0011AC4085|nr:DUF2931 family protein [Apibacter muscae]TWP23865.1 DUF2931 family protein [Apibacter muscae]